jgi:hypothetical protein
MELWWKLWETSQVLGFPLGWFLGYKAALNYYKKHGTLPERIFSTGREEA